MIQGRITWISRCGGDYGVVRSPRSVTCVEAGTAHWGKFSPEGLFCVTTKNFLVSLSCLLGLLRPGKAFLFPWRRKRMDHARTVDPDLQDQTMGEKAFGLQSKGGEHEPISSSQGFTKGGES